MGMTQSFEVPPVHAGLLKRTAIVHTRQWEEMYSLVLYLGGSVKVRYTASEDLHLVSQM